MRNLFLVSLLFAMGISPLLAQEKMLTKQEAIVLALDNNFGIKVAQNQVEIADNNQSMLNSGYLPSLT
ncbi:MAG: TolC family protein, partial [Flavobacteriaceae bacterium]